MASAGWFPNGAEFCEARFRQSQTSAKVNFFVCNDNRSVDLAVPV
jgi:hypothetical protein